MAVTKIHAIKSTLNKALDYVENPDKTDGQMLVYGYNVDPVFASTEFLLTQALAREISGDNRGVGGADNLAYHLMQSFSPKDRITPEQAHEIGKNLAAEFLEGRYEYVVTTHLDKGHIHNHIIINAVSFYDQKKLRTVPYKTVAKIRAISDRICKENALSVLPEKANRGYSRTEYLARKENTSWKSEIRKRLKYVLETSVDYTQFINRASALGVTVNDEGKHIKYRLAGQERYTRGNKLSAGDEFLPEGIKRRLLENSLRLGAADQLTDEQFAAQYESYATRMADSKPEQNAGDGQGLYGRLSRLQSHEASAKLKDLSAALMVIRREGINEIGDFDRVINGRRQRITEMKDDIKEIEGKNKRYKDTAKFLITIQDYQDRREKSGLSDKTFERRNEGETRAYIHAVRELQKRGVDMKVDPKKVMSLILEQRGRAAGVSEEIGKIEGEIEGIRSAQAVVNEMLRRGYGGEMKRERNDVEL